MCIRDRLLPLMTKDESQLQPLSASGRIGLGWGNAGGEVGGLLIDNYLAADGIINILRVLESLEDEKIHGLKFVELSACNGGCVGGVLTVENPYVAESKTKKITRYLPVSYTHLDVYKRQHKSRLLTAYESHRAKTELNIKIKAAAENIFSQQTVLSCLVNCDLKPLYRNGIFRTYINISLGSADGVSGNSHCL